MTQTLPSTAFPKTPARLQGEEFVPPGTRTLNEVRPGAPQYRPVLSPYPLSLLTPAYADLCEGACCNDARVEVAELL